MKIRNDYPVYSGQHYDTHSSAPAENTMKPAKEEAADTVVLSGTGKAEGYRIRRQNVELTLHTAMPGKNAEKVSRKDSFLKEFWNRLGEEGQAEKGQAERRSLLAVLKETVWSPLYGVFLRAGEVLKGFFSKDLEGGISGLSARFKSELSAAMKKIGKGNLHGLTDGQTLSGGASAHADSRQEQQKEEEQAAGTEPVTYVRSSHIMDSYTKDGTYCTIGDINYRRTDKAAAYPKRNTGEE